MEGLSREREGLVSRCATKRALTRALALDYRTKRPGMLEGSQERLCMTFPEGRFKCTQATEAYHQAHVQHNEIK